MPKEYFEYFYLFSSVRWVFQLILNNSLSFFQVFGRNKPVTVLELNVLWEVLLEGNEGWVRFTKGVPVVAVGLFPQHSSWRYAPAYSSLPQGNPDRCFTKPPSKPHLIFTVAIPGASAALGLYKAYPSVLVPSRKPLLIVPALIDLSLLWTLELLLFLNHLFWPLLSY